jgi:hypothetical protein
MAGLRLKGQEVELRITKSGVLKDTITKITNFNFAAKMEMLEQGFLGATTNEYDEVYNGCSFSFEVHLDGPDWLTFQQEVQDKARRVTPDVKFSIAATLFFPDGVTKGLIIPDAHFGEMPVAIGGRNEFVTATVDGGASEYTIQDL